jgi:hypothetical protein
MRLPQNRELLAEVDVLGGQLSLAAKQQSKKNAEHLYPTHVPLPSLMV